MDNIHITEIQWRGGWIIEKVPGRAPFISRLEAFVVSHTRNLFWSQTVFSILIPYSFLLAHFCESCT
jgi:hypothetical protein